MKLVNPLSSCFLYGIVDLGYVAAGRPAIGDRATGPGRGRYFAAACEGAFKAEIVKYAEAMLPLTKAAGVPLIIKRLSGSAARGRCRRMPCWSRGFQCRRSPRSGWSNLYRRRVDPYVRTRPSGSKERRQITSDFGPLFPTGTKPSAKAVGLSDIRALHEQVQLPIFVIGGVKLR